MGKYDKYREEVTRISEETGWGSRKIADKIVEDSGLDVNPSSMSRWIRRKGLIKRSIVNESMHRNNLFPDNNWKVSWIKDSETGTSTLVENPNYGTENQITIEDIKEVVSSMDIKRKVPRKRKARPFALRGITTDEHVGLEPNPDNDSLFSYQYDAEVFKDCMQKYFEAIVNMRDTYGRAEVLWVDSLGDMMDGWGGQTTRGGHALPQNMDNKKAFEVAVKEKVELIDGLVQEDIANKIQIRTITNDNHGGSFSWIVAKAVQMVCERIYGEYVEFINIERFIEHFHYGKHCFMLSHGKDRVDMKRGLPIRLDDKTIRYIRSYMDYYEIDSKYNHFDKGDLHQTSFDKTRKLNYRNFMAFSPPSRWVQTNFGDTYSGFSTQLVPKESSCIIHTDHFFEFKK